MAPLPLHFLTALGPPGSLAPRNSQRACWVWHSAAWRLNAKSVFNLLERTHCTLIYLSVPHRIKAGDSSQLDKDVQIDLAQFVQQATTRGIAVWATEGDPHFALSKHKIDLKNHIQSLFAFNKSQPTPATQLAGLQFDIEPWLLPQWTLSRESLLSGWINAVELATHSEYLPSLFKIDVVLPYWIQPKQKEFELLFAKLTKSSVCLTIMNYQTNPAKFTQTAQLFLEWGSAVQQHVRIAIERGKIVEANAHTEKISFASLKNDTFMNLAAQIEESLWKFAFFDGLSLHGLDQL